MHLVKRSRWATVAVAALLCAVAATAPAAFGAPPGTGANRGALTFPDDESAHLASWDYWWGAANLVTTSGNRYVLAIAYTQQDGLVSSSYALYPLQGAYRGQGFMSDDGPADWGHTASGDQLVHNMTWDLPGAQQRLRLDTVDATAGNRLIDRWQRTNLAAPTYRLTLDQPHARMFPGGEPIDIQADLHATMADPPLLAGGTGRWFYGVPEDFGLPSRGFQYQQVARVLTGGFTVRWADGRTIAEQVDPARSTLSMTHESNPVEDIPVGLGLAISTQLHARYLQYYNLQWPWELVYADLGNGAQLMFDVQAYHDTPNGLMRQLGVDPNQPTYRVLATLRLPSGVSVPLDRELHVEHLSYRHLDGVSGALLQGVGLQRTLESLVTQAWQYRVSYGGGTLATPDGGHVTVPAFDLGLDPAFSRTEPLADPHGNRLVQRVPFDVSGSYDDCPVHGFAWSEVLVNWYGWEGRDPWFTGGDLPETPAHCGDPVAAPPSGPPGDLDPPATTNGAPDGATDGCEASYDKTRRCRYVAHHAGLVTGSGDLPDGWTVAIDRPGLADLITIHSHGGFESYMCGTIRPGDTVTATAATPGADVSVGDNGLCF